MKVEHRISWHPTGGWCRKFSGDRNRTYFGRVTPGEAVRAMVDEENRRAKGATAEAHLTNLTVREAVNLFLTHLDQQHADGKIGVVQRARYGDEIDRFLTFAGKSRRLTDVCKLNAPEELFRPLRNVAMARGIFAAEKHVIQVRTFLEWCSTTRRFIPAPFYADAFALPGDKEKRAAKKTARKVAGVAYWTPAEVRQIVDAAKATSHHRHAQILLMLNGGFGASDLAHLDDADVDWARSCIHTDRSKTLVPRVVPLWSETAAAMKASRAERPAASDPKWASRFFLTPKGKPIVLETLVEGDKETGRRRKTARTDAIRNWFFALLNGPDRKEWATPAVRLRGLKRSRAGAYTLRSVFATLAQGHPLADATLIAVIMGHKLPNAVMEWYLRGDLLEKLSTVTNHVRLQIWPDA